MVKSNEGERLFKTLLVTVGVIGGIGAGISKTVNAIGEYVIAPIILAPSATYYYFCSDDEKDSNKETDEEKETK